MESCAKVFFSETPQVKITSGQKLYLKYSFSASYLFV